MEKYNLSNKRPDCKYAEYKKLLTQTGSFKKKKKKFELYLYNGKRMKNCFRIILLEFFETTLPGMMTLEKQWTCIKSLKSCKHQFKIMF